MWIIRNLFKRVPFGDRIVTGAPVSVVGMHRSGTSLLAGSLQQAGLELGKHSTWNPYNLKGNRENEDIVRFHDAVLRARGYAWDDPPAEEVVWTSDERRQACVLIQDYREVTCWGFKDPRTLLSVEGWRQLLPNLRFVGIFRHPTAVAQSLAARSGMPEDQAFSLWKAYNVRLLRLHQQQPFPLLCFDDDESLLHQKLNDVLYELDLSPLDEDRFFSAGLKHHGRLERNVPIVLDALYEQLRACAR